MSEPYTLDAIAARYVFKAAGYLHRRYRMWRIDADDVASEMRVWIYGEGRERVERWLENDPQQTTRIYRSLLDVGLKFCENEKAEKVGYAVSDVYWYTPNSIEKAMPLVLNPDWTEDGGAIGELATIVVDIRRVMTPAHYEFFTYADSADPDWHGHVQDLLNRLGSLDRPRRRRAMSNAQSIAVTGEAWAG